MRISDWSSDVCSSDLFALGPRIVIRADSRPCRFGPAALVDRPAAIDVGGGGHVGCPVRDASSALMSALGLALPARLPAAIAALSSRSLLTLLRAAATPMSGSPTTPTVTTRNKYT